jgi:hypothetical protein
VGVGAGGMSQTCSLPPFVVRRARRRGSYRSIFQSFLWCGLGLVQALAVVFAITNLLKMMTGEPGHSAGARELTLQPPPASPPPPPSMDTGRQRPNFLALCDYAGYRSAIASGDLTQYQRLTTFNAIGDVSKCRANFEDVAESLRSFPSG